MPLLIFIIIILSYSAFHKSREKVIREHDIKRLSRAYGKLFVKSIPDGDIWNQGYIRSLYLGFWRVTNGLPYARVHVDW